MTATHVKDVDAATFSEQVVERSRQVPVVVDFWAAWCGPCKVLGPTLERLAAEFEGGFELAKVDVDSNQALASRFGVQGIPTVVGFRDGQPIGQFTGALPEADVREWLSEIVPSEADLLAATAADLLSEGDRDAAERGYREALQVDTKHTAAAIGLASLMIDDGRHEEALLLLDPLPSGREVDRLRAAARMAAVDGRAIPDLEAGLASEPDNQTLRIDLGRALAAQGDYEPALANLLEAVEAGGATREDARRATLDVFEMLGADHELTVAYRRRLASALF